MDKEGSSGSFSFLRDYLCLTVKMLVCSEECEVGWRLMAQTWGFFTSSFQDTNSNLGITTHFQSCLPIWKYRKLHMFRPPACEMALQSTESKARCQLQTQLFPKLMVQVWDHPHEPHLPAVCHLNVITTGSNSFGAFVLLHTRGKSFLEFFILNRFF